eukprot:6134854-Alexandrium_andersonii.AAC.1
MTWYGERRGIPKERARGAVDEATRRVSSQGLEPAARDAAYLQLGLPPTAAAAKISLLNVRKSWEIERRPEAEQAAHV